MPKIDLDKLIAAIDEKDADGFVSFMTDDGTFRYGSQPPVQGKEAVRDYVTGFFGTVAALSHTVDDTWERGDTMVMCGEATYTRQDGGVVTVPYTNVFYLKGDRIQQYLIYTDPTPLFS